MGRAIPLLGGVAPAVLLASVLSSCGEGGGNGGPAPLRYHPAQRRDAAVPMARTPARELVACRRSPLLRPVCPRKLPVPVRGGLRPRVEGVCVDAKGADIGNGVAEKRFFVSPRCVDAGWFEEAGAPVPGSSLPYDQVQGWDGTRWFLPGFAAKIPPPYLVHVDIEASVGDPPISLRNLGPLGHPRHAMDSLLNPHRTRRPVSLGRVRWAGRGGRLVLLSGPVGGEQAGHLIFAFTANRVTYDVSLHAWTAKVRLSAGRVITSRQPGPALPHVIATLKAIVASTDAG